MAKGLVYTPYRNHKPLWLWGAFLFLGPLLAQAQPLAPPQFFGAGSAGDSPRAQGNVPVTSAPYRIAVRVIGSDGQEFDLGSYQAALCGPSGELDSWGRASDSHRIGGNCRICTAPDAGRYRVRVWVTYELEVDEEMLVPHAAELYRRARRKSVGTKVRKVYSAPVDEAGILEVLDKNKHDLYTDDLGTYKVLSVDIPSTCFGELAGPDPGGTYYDVTPPEPSVSVTIRKMRWPVFLIEQWTHAGTRAPDEGGSSKPVHESVFNCMGREPGGEGMDAVTIVIPRIDDRLTRIWESCAKVLAEEGGSRVIEQTILKETVLRQLGDLGKANAAGIAASTLITLGSDGLEGLANPEFIAGLAAGGIINAMALSNPGSLLVALAFEVAPDVLTDAVRDMELNADCDSDDYLIYATYYEEAGEPRGGEVRVRNFGEPLYNVHVRANGVQVSPEIAVLEGAATPSAQSLPYTFSKQVWSIEETRGSARRGTLPKMALAYETQPVPGKKMAYQRVFDPERDESSGKLDVVFCIDRSGSMSDSLELVKANTMPLLNSLQEYCVAEDIGLRVGLTSFTRHDEANWVSTWPLSQNVQAVNANIQQWAAAPPGAGRGGNEDLYGALMYAMNETVGGRQIDMGWRPGAAKVMLPIGDEPPDDPDWEGRTLADVARTAEALDPVHMYPLLMPKQGNRFLDPAVSALGRLADATGGELVRVGGASELPGQLVNTIKQAVRRHRNEVWRATHPPYLLYGVLGAIVLLAVLGVGGLLFHAVRAQQRQAPPV